MSQAPLPSAAVSIAAWTGFLIQSRLKTLAIWCLSLAALIALMVAVFPSFGDSAAYEELLDAYPEKLRKAFGIEETDQLGTAIGFLNAEVFGLLLPLAISFLPLGYVSYAISHAEERGYLETGLSLPVARWHLAVATAVAGAAALAAALSTVLLSALLTAAVAGVELAAADIAQSCLSLWPLASLFAVIGLVVACGTKRSTRAVGIAAGTLVGMYAVDIVASIASGLGWLRHFTIFDYYSRWLTNGIDLVEYLAVIIICAALTALAAVLFERRDLAS